MQMTPTSQHARDLRQTPATPAERPILFSGPMVRAILEGRKTQTRRVVKDLHVRTRKQISSELPGCSLSADPRWLYEADLNKAGAVSARVGVGREGLLGLKPGEFDFRCPYATGETILSNSTTWRILAGSGQRLWVRETWARYEPFPVSGESSTDGMLCLPALPLDNELLPYWRKRLVFAADGDWKKPEDEDGKGAYDPRWRPSIHLPRWASRITLEINDVRLERLQNITPDDACSEGTQYPVSKSDTSGQVHPLINISNKHITPHLMALKNNYTHENLMLAHFAGLWDSINAARGFGWDSNPWVWAITFRRLA